MQQAQLTAQRLSSLPIAVIHHSTLRRATETAAIIASKLPGVPLRRSRLLWECTPCVPMGYEAHFAQTPAEQIEQGRQQAEQAFARYFRNTRGADRHEVIVCHGNIIRYFLCRALQIAPEHWANTDIYTCGISEFVIAPKIKPTSDVMLVSHNDTGHLPYPMRTF